VKQNVPLYDHAKLYASEKPQIDAAIARVLTSGALDWGDEVPAFEAELAAWLGAAHVVGVGSGTAALKSALLALGIGPGDEVITVPNNDIAGSSAIRFVGATPVWVDIDPATRNIDIIQTEAAITPRTRAILPVDMYGHPADLVALRALADQHGLHIIEDACLALGAEISGQKIGTFADVTCFSFAPTKNLGAFGSAGACVTEDARVAERLRMVSAYGQARDRHTATFAGGNAGLRHQTDGLNERMDEIQAAILRVKLPGLDATLAQRREQAARYQVLLSGSGIDLPVELGPVRHAWRNYVVELDDRDAIRAHLTDQGIGTNMPYAPPMHLQPVYAELGYGAGRFPHAERSAERLMGLPIGPHLGIAEIDTVAHAVRLALGAASP
jgi:dTDP-4-amino-4,6-dideoxygalactose transaminase